ncbi:MAG TPA: glycosyltransferase [Phycisphaerae bacterium]|nr:glycosyltransferase [Phycisphaerae bacterium]
MTPRPRILFIDHTAALGGGEIALLNLAQAIDKNRFDISVLLFADGPLAEKLRAAAIDVRIEPLAAAIGDTRKDSLGARSLGKLSQSWAFTSRLKRILKELNPDLVHTNSLKSDILAGIAARRARIPVVWHIRDRIVPEYLPRTVVRLFRRLCRWIPRHVIAISHSVLETLRLPPRFTREHARARIVYDGVLLPQPRARPPAPLRIGIVGRISPWKGQHIFLQAAAQVRSKFPNARFVIIGAALFAENDYEQQIHRLTDELNLRAAVEFTGFRTDVPDLIDSLDILVHASTIGEPFGQVVAEGMAAAKPVVATRGGGVPEIMMDGESGLLVPMADAAAMAGAIVRLGDDPDLRHRMGAAARQRIEAQFTIDRTARGVEAVWNHVLGNPAR